MDGLVARLNIHEGENLNLIKTSIKKKRHKIEF